MHTLLHTAALTCLLLAAITYGADKRWPETLTATGLALLTLTGSGLIP